MTKDLLIGQSCVESCGLRLLHARLLPSSTPETVVVTWLPAGFVCSLLRCSISYIHRVSLQLVKAANTLSPAVMSIAAVMVSVSNTRSLLPSTTEALR